MKSVVIMPFGALSSIGHKHGDCGVEDVLLLASSIALARRWGLLRCRAWYMKMSRCCGEVVRRKGEAWMG